MTTESSKPDARKVVPSDEQACVNTDRELWREPPGDYYSASIHVTEGGGIGINCGGNVFVMSIREWHKLAAMAYAAPAAPAWTDGELLPCPCCGGKANRRRVDEDGPNFAGEYIECSGCGLTTMLMFPCKDDVFRQLAELWNRRAGLAAAAPAKEPRCKGKDCPTPIHCGDLGYCRDLPAPSPDAAPAKEPVTDLEEYAWTILANVSGGDWTLQNEDWQGAVKRWREQYHAKLAAATPPEKELVDKMANPQGSLVDKSPNSQGQHPPQDAPDVAALLGAFDSIDTLLFTAGYQPDSSARHQLSMLRSMTHAALTAMARERDNDRELLRDAGMDYHREVLRADKAEAERDKLRDHLYEAIECLDNGGTLSDDARAALKGEAS